MDTSKFQCQDDIMLYSLNYIFVHHIDYKIIINSYQSVNIIRGQLFIYLCVRTHVGAHAHTHTHKYLQPEYLETLNWALLNVHSVMDGNE